MAKPTDPVLAFYTSGIILEFLFGLWIYGAYLRWPRAFDRLLPVAVIGLVALLAQNFVDIAYRELSKGIPAAVILIGMVSLPVQLFEKPVGRLLNRRFSGPKRLEPARS